MKIEIGDTRVSEDGWITEEHIASVRVSSQQAGYPIESIFADNGADNGVGWRAGGPGRQTIRIVLEAPRRVRRIQLHFSEPQVERTQEFVLTWAPSLEGAPRELLRQQWNFSPQGSTSQIEDLRLDLDGALVFELAITPDIRNGTAVATLQRFRIQ